MKFNKIYGLIHVVWSTMKSEISHLVQGPLFKAIRNDDVRLLKRLLAIRPIRNQVSKKVFQLACRMGHIEIVNLLLQIPAVENRAHLSQNLALVMAARSGHRAVVNRLLQIPAVAKRAPVLKKQKLRLIAKVAEKAVNFTMLSHRDLINYMKKLNINVNDGGICNGVSNMAIPSLLLGDIGKFIARLADVAKDIDPSNAKKLTSTERYEKEITAFFEGVQLHQSIQCHDYPEFFKEGEKQDIHKLIMSQEIEKEGGIYKVNSFCHIYDKKKLENIFLPLLREGIRKYSIGGQLSPIALTLSNLSHKICLGYDIKKDKWVLIDANRLLLQGMFFGSDKNVADIIFSSLMRQRTKAILNIDIYSTDKNRGLSAGLCDALQKNSQWVEAHQITNETAIFCDSRNKTMLRFASKNGNLAIVKELLDLGANPNQKSNKVKSPLLKAILNKQFDIVEVLLKKGATFNQADRCYLLQLLQVVARNEDAVNPSQCSRCDFIPFYATKSQPDVVEDAANPSEAKLELLSQPSP